VEEKNGEAHFLICLKQAVQEDAYHRWMKSAYVEAQQVAASSSTEPALI
jgi:hypothetical protein